MARGLSAWAAHLAQSPLASVAHWNPAALASLQRQEIGLAYADRFGLGLNHSYLNYVLPLEIITLLVLIGYTLVLMIPS